MINTWQKVGSFIPAIWKGLVCSCHISYLCNVHRKCGTIAYFWHFCTWLLPAASWVLEMVKVLPVSQEQHLLHLNLCVSCQECSSVFHWQILPVECYRLLLRGRLQWNFTPLAQYTVKMIHTNQQLKCN